MLEDANWSKTRACIVSLFYSKCSKSKNATRNKCNAPIAWSWPRSFRILSVRLKFRWFE